MKQIEHLSEVTDVQPEKSRFLRMRTAFFHFFVFTPLHLFLEWLMFFNLATNAIAVTFFELNKDYASSIIAYLLTRWTREEVSAALLTATVLSLIGLITGRRLLRIVNMLFSCGYLLAYVGALLALKIFALVAYLAIAFPILLTLSIFKIAFVRKTTYTVR